MSPSPSPVPLAARLAKLPPYLFAEIDKQKREARARGVDLIDMGIGDPDLPTPPHIIEAIKRSAETPANHRYPDYEGLLSFRTAVADWYRKRFGVTLDPQTEVLTLIGSKEGTAHMPLAFVNPGDVVLVPDPGYPVYAAGTWFAGGEVHWMPLRRANGFLPDLDAIPADVAKRARLMYLNYPNNPTAAVAGKEFFAKVVDFARRHQIIVCHDAMYSELRFDGYRPPSFLETPGAMEVGVEFHSLSKTYSMTGWRIGFCVGNAGAIAGPREDQDQRGLGRVPGGAGGGHRRAHRAAGARGAVPPHLPGAARRGGGRPQAPGLGGGRAQGRLLRLGPGAGRPRLPHLRRPHAERGGLRDHPRRRLRPLRGGLLPDRAHHRRQAPGGGDGPPAEAQALTSDKIFLEDVRFYGHHGVTRAQQTVGAWFAVDAELMLDLAPAAASDDLRSTLDYGVIAARIVEVSTKERVNLLERLAGRLAQMLLAEFPCDEVRVRVRKLTPPMEGLQGIPGVELTRRRR